MPIHTIGGSSLSEVVQQAFSPAVAVLSSPEVNDLIYSKNRLSFVELLQPFSRLSVEGQIRDPSTQGLHSVTQFRLSVRDITWKPASVVLSRRLLSESVINYTANENRKIINAGLESIEVNPHTPWYDSWRETLWSCLEMTDHDFTRHYLATLLVVSSSHPNPVEQFHQMDNHLTQLIANNGTNDGPRWFNTTALRYHVLVHDACDGSTSDAEKQFQAMRNAFGGHTCHLLVINSKPKKGLIPDSGLPAPDPWIRFLPRKSSKSEVSSEGEAPLDGLSVGGGSLPVKVVEGPGIQSLDAVPKIPLMDALQEAMQEITIGSILPPSASTLALSSLVEPNGKNHAGIITQRSAVEIKTDPLTGDIGQTDHARNHEDTVGRVAVGTGMSNDEIHGGCLTTDDVDRIQNMINDFCLKSLLPHMERQMKLFHEAAASRKSTHRTLLTATKRLFGGSRPGGGPIAPQAVSYLPESAQLQVRRLGDLAFLLGHYELAYQSYHSAKKDFEADQAWLHFAGALEMAVLSYVLQYGQSQGRIPFHYFETALTTYLQTCKMPNWATRCAILSSECLKLTGQYNDAALQLIRLTSEDADLRSAVLLEQAALCFLRSALKLNNADAILPNTTPLIRKYAFHMILAGHRFGKSGQKRHASRAYQLALQVYRGHGWSLAEDHIHYTVGQQCLNGQQIEEACQALAALLRPGSMQAAAQQTAYLNEFIHVHQLLIKYQQTENKTLPSLPILPLPIIDGSHIKVLVDTRDPTASPPSVGITEANNVNFSDDEVHHSKWATMEEKLVHAGLGTTPALFRTTNFLFTSTTNNTVHPQTYCDELISVEVPLTNPLRIPVQLCDIRLLWQFTGVDGQLSNMIIKVDNPLITTYVIPKLQLDPNACHKLILHVKPKAEGLLNIEGIAFDLRPVNVEPAAAAGGLVSSVSGRVMFSVRGHRLNTTQQERHGIVYAVDKRLSIQVGPPMPKLRVLFHSLPEFLFSGEIRSVKIELSNSNPKVPMTNIFIAMNDPLHLIIDLPRVETVVNPRVQEQPVAIYRWNPTMKSTTLWVKGSENVGLTSLDLLFFYTNPDIKSKYRILRHCSKIFVSSSLSLNTWVQRVPSVPALKGSAEDCAETLSIQVQVRNLRDVDDTSLSGIQVRQVSLLSDRWLLRPIQSTVPDGVLHPQESLICALLAVRANSQTGKLCESVTLKVPSNGGALNFNTNPYQPLIKEFQKTSSETTLAVSWTATQASDDGNGTLVIEGQQYISCGVQETSSAPNLLESTVKSPQQLITYSMDYSTYVFHDFNKQRICIIPVVLHLHNCSKKEVTVQFTANGATGKPMRATQLYMPEAASPLLWIGRVEGELNLRSASETVHLAIAVSRPGVYSLSRGLQINAKVKGENVSVPSPKLEFTLIVDQKNV